MIRTAAAGALIGVAVVAAAALPQRGAAESAFERGRLIAVGGGPTGAVACFSCHGQSGGGDLGSGTPRLSGLSGRYLAGQLDAYADGRRQSAIMRPIAQALSAEDRQAVALYYSQRFPAGPPTRSELDATRLQRGAVIFALGAAERGVQACVNCHGPAGRGLEPYPALAGQPARYVVGELRAWRSGQRQTDALDQMRTIATQLRPEDVEALGAYIESLTP